MSRALRNALAHPDGDGSPPPALELSGLILEPPRLRDCTVVEGQQLRRHAVGEPEVRIAAFLDGAQRSHVADYAGTIPIVAGRTAAVIRSRVDRRMTTWGEGPSSMSRLYAPTRHLPSAAVAQIEAAGLDIRDTLAANDEVSLHPLELLRRAVDAVKADRERQEFRLAESWVAAEQAPLFVDGGLPNGPAASVSAWCIGVVKSHHVIHTPVGGLDVVLALRESERTSVMVIERNWGPRVLSWYLRLREAPSHDPFMGLVRVEVAHDAQRATASALAGRADDVSRWILAERSPLSLPDARWDRMVYGIRDCEEYLRASELRD